MGGIQKKIFAVLAFVIGFVAVKYGLQLYSEHSAVAAAEHSIEQMKQQGVEKHPELLMSEAMQQEAVSKTNKKLQTETDQRKRLNTAASMFMGFYLINTRERPQFCNEFGVDISPFVSAFSQAHKSELAKAQAGFTGSPVTLDKLYTMLQPQLRKLITQDMKDIASQSHTSIQGACELVSDNGVALASEMHISKIQPDVYQALTSIQ